MKSTRKMQASTEIFEQIIDHVTSQQVANYAFANTQIFDAGNNR